MPSKEIPRPIQSRLNQVRRSLLAWQWIVGISRILAVLTILMICSLIIDRLFRMDFSQRLICLMLGIGALVWTVWRYLLRPLAAKVTDDALVQKVESANPETGNSLISALQFATIAELPAGASKALIGSVISQGAAAAEAIDFREILDWRNFKRFLIIGGIALAIPVAGAAIKYQDMSLLSWWFKRNVLLSRTLKWPQNTYLTVVGAENNQLTVAEGGNLEIVVKAQGKSPDDVTLRYEDEAGTTYTEQMPLLGDGTYRTTFSGVVEAFRFTVRGGDDKTEEISVLLLPRPEVSTLKVSMLPPAYVGKKEIPFDAGLSTYPVLQGASVRIDGVSSLPLKRTELKRGTAVIADITGSGETEFSVIIPADQLASGTYGLTLTSQQDISSLRPMPIALRQIPDRAPQVKAKLAGIGQLILARAKVPISAAIKDDYGVAKAMVDFSSESQDQSSNRAGQLPLKVPEGEASLSFSAQQVLDLKDLKPALETTFTLRVTAEDRNSISGPGIGQSGSFTLRVVAEQELRNDFTRREQELRARFDSLLAQQRELIDETKLFLAAAKAKESQKTLVKIRQLRAEKAQRRLISTVGQLVDGFAQIRAEAENNRLEVEPYPLRQRLEFRIMQPLTTIRQQSLPVAVDGIAVARELPEDKQGMAWQKVEAAQSSIVLAMLEIRKHMIESEDVQKAIRLMEEILASQKKLNRATVERMSKQIEGLFND